MFFYCIISLFNNDIPALLISCEQCQESSAAPAQPISEVRYLNSITDRVNLIQTDESTNQSPGSNGPAASTNERGGSDTTAAVV